MFSKSKPTPDSALVPSPGAAKMATGARHTTFSIIGSDVVITGNLSATVDLHVDGRIDGDLSCANLVQGEASEIHGAVIAESAKLAGLINGSIDAKHLVIHASARVTGDVTYDNLTIEPGGQVEGRFTHRRNAGQQAKAPLELVADGGLAV